MSLARKPAGKILCISLMLAALVLGGMRNADATTVTGTVVENEPELMSSVHEPAGTFSV